jgi:hypothetical protein
MTATPTLSVERGHQWIEITSTPGLRPKPAQLVMFFVLLTFAVSSSLGVERIAAAVVSAAALAWWCLRPTIVTRFTINDRRAAVTRVNVLWRRTNRYDFEQVLVLSVEDNLLKMRLFDGKAEILSYEHDSVPALRQAVAEVCAETGLSQARDLGVPEPHGRPVAFTGAGVGIYIEGPIAVLSAPGCAMGSDGRLFFGRTTVVFDNLNRQVQVTKELLGNWSKIFRYDEIDNLKIEERDNEGVTYRFLIEMADGKRIGIGSGASCSRYEIAFMAQQLSAHSGVRCKHDLE